MEDIELLNKSELISLVRELRADNERLKAENALYKTEVEELKVVVVELRATIAEFREEISRLKIRKNSHNSSKPPSTDLVRGGQPRKNQSLRPKGGKQRGGQPGHKGDTLFPVMEPDQIVEHIPNHCESCGSGLTEIEGTLIGSRQVVDIPPITPIYIEHRCYSKTCACGHKTTTTFPKGVENRIQYGPFIMALIAYLSVRQYIPYNRIKEFFGDVCGLKISEGGIQRLLERMTDKSLWLYDQIKDRIMASKVVGADETGGKIAGKKGWFWTWQNEKLTFIVSSLSRGYQTVEKHFPNGFPDLILVQDCWSVHFKTPARLRQICMAHLLRDLNYIVDVKKSAEWAKMIKKIILEAIEFKRQLSPEDFPIQGDALKKAQEFEHRLDQLLQNEIPQDHEDARKLQKRLLKWRKYIFPFLYYAYVPPDNNGSERAIRNTKVKLKVSGQFVSEKGAHCFAVIRSIIDTSIKSGQYALNALVTIAKVG